MPLTEPPALAALLPLRGTTIDDTPLHRQIRQQLRARILDGSYAPDSRMPSEAELGAIFGVSRITVRQALSDLQKEGLIHRIHGKGTFVARPKAFQNVTHLQGFAEAMGAMGYEIVNDLRRFSFVPAEAAIAQKLGLEAGDTVAEIHRVRFLNRQPVSLEVTWLPEQIGRRLENADLVTRDIFLILENNCGLPLGHADLSIESILADDDLVKALRVEEGAPVLRIERLTHDADGQPIDYEHLYFRGDAFQYRFRIDRQHSKGQA